MYQKLILSKEKESLTFIKELVDMRVNFVYITLSGSFIIKGWSTQIDVFGPNLDKIHQLGLTTFSYKRIRESMN